jgi:hypothetical protein
MKIIFLDIDGVLNGHAFLAAQSKKVTSEPKLYRIDDDETWLGMLDPENVAKLNEIVEATDAKVVISSSWRCPHAWEKIAGWLCKKGFKGEVIGATDDACTWPEEEAKVADRCDEIQRWLETHGLSHRGALPHVDGIESYVVLDDCTIGGGYSSSRLVRTHPARGLVAGDVKMAIGVLRGDGVVSEGRKLTRLVNWLRALEALTEDDGPVCTACYEESACNDGGLCRDCMITQMVDETVCEYCGRQIWNDNAKYLGMKSYDHAESCPYYCEWCKSHGCLVCQPKIDAVRAEEEQRERENRAAHAMAESILTGAPPDLARALRTVPTPGILP